MLMGHKPLPSEGERSVLAAVPDRNAQRLLRNLIRRDPDARWDAAKVASCLWLKTSDFQVGGWVEGGLGRSLMGG